MRLDRPFASPYRDASVGRPRNDHVSADLGEQLDGELTPVTLRNGLQDRDGRLRTRLRAPLEHGQLKLAWSGRRHDTLREHPRAVGDVDSLAGREAADRAGVPTLLASQDETFSGQVSRRRDEDWRPQVRAALGSATVEGIAQPGEQALLPRRELAGRRFLAAQLG